MKNKELDKIMDDVAAGIRSERIDDNLVSECERACLGAA